jgi:hypothetical protein
MSVASSVSTAEGDAPGYSRLIAVDDPFPAAGSVASGYEMQLCALLEAGHILFLPQSPISIPVEDRELLLGRKQTSSAYHKNIAYRPAEDRVTGLDASEQKEAAELRRLLSDYSRRATEFLDRFLTPYAGKRKLDYASFRPIEEKGRAARLHARNDLLHFDSFPTRPTNGARILRLFTNINPAQNRVWMTSQTFEAFGPRLARSAGLLEVGSSPVLRAMRSVTRALRLPLKQRPPYDEIMHRCHNAMKEDTGFQGNAAKNQWEFPPDSTWLVFTDCVSHSVLEGQYALEQTFLIPQTALVRPEASPLAILERLTGNRLTI